MTLKVKEERNRVWQRCGEDDDADYYDTSESEVEGPRVWQILKKKKRLEPGKLGRKKKTLIRIYSHSHREVHTSGHDGEKA